MVLDVAAEAVNALAAEAGQHFHKGRGICHAVVHLLVDVDAELLIGEVEGEKLAALIIQLGFDRVGERVLFEFVQGQLGAGLEMRDAPEDLIEDLPQVEAPVSQVAAAHRIEVEVILGFVEQLLAQGLLGGLTVAGVHGFLELQVGLVGFFNFGLKTADVQLAVDAHDVAVELQYRQGLERVGDGNCDRAFSSRHRWKRITSA